MTVLAFAKLHAGEICRIDLGSGQQPELVYKASFFPVDLNRFAYAPDGKIYFLSMYNNNKIFVNESKNTEKLLYTHPNPITNVRIKAIGNAPLKYRVYFSASLVPNGYTESETIYYLNDQNKPVEYHTYSGADLPFDDPCSPGSQTHYTHWSGDFCFDDKDNIYLANGAKKPGVIYMATGATENTVKGSLHRIIEDNDDSFGDLAFEAPNSLYFTRPGPEGSGTDKIYRLDFSPTKVNDVYSWQRNPPGERMADIAVVPVTVKKRRLTESLIVSARNFGKSLLRQFGH